MILLFQVEFYFIEIAIFLVDKHYIIFDHVACFVDGKRTCKQVKSFAYGKISNMMCQYFIEKSSMRLERAHQNQ